MTQVATHEAYVQVEREIGLLLRRSRAIQGRLAGELHADLDGAAYGLLVLRTRRLSAARTALVELFAADLPSSTAALMAATQAAFCTASGRSMPMPTVMKKRPSSRPLKGWISAATWWR